jgi:hypothetical protein
MFILLVIMTSCGSDSSAGNSNVSEAFTDAVMPTPTLLSAPATPTSLLIVGGSSGDSDSAADSTSGFSDSGGLASAWPTEDFGYGIQIHGDATIGDPVATMQIVRDQLGLDWVKMQVHWWRVHPTPDAEQWLFYDGVVDEAAAHDLRVMVSVVGAPEWTRALGTRNGPPDDFNLYAEFLTELLHRYAGQIQAVEVWNEQNLAREWTTTNGISPEDYVNFLKLSYQTIKGIDSNIVVISGALSPTGPGDWIDHADDFEYMDRALAAGMLSYADCVGAHHNGYNIGPDVTMEEAGDTAEAETAFFRGPFDNPYHLWSFKTTLDTYAAKVQAIDPNKRLCVTEFGWASSEGYDEYPELFDFALDNTLQEQSEFIVQAFQQMRNSGEVWLAFVFNLDYGNKGRGPKDDTVPFSIIDTQGAPRPAFSAIAAMEKTR